MGEEKEWLEKAKGTYEFHRSKLLTQDKWTITKTAKSLRRSIGSICEDLTIARALKIHRKQLEKFNHAYEALKFIREKKKFADIDEIEE